MLKFLKDFFTPDFGQYDNFNFNEGSFVTFSVVIAGIFFGVILAAFFAVYNRRVLGAFVREIIKREAFSKEKALTVGELGFAKNPFVKFSLFHGNTLRRAVSCVERDEFLESLEANTAEDKKKLAITAKFKTDETSHFYIPEDKKYKMEYKFDKKGTSWGMLIFCIIVLTIVTAVAINYLPKIILSLDKWLKTMG